MNRKTNAQPFFAMTALLAVWLVSSATASAQTTAVESGQSGAASPTRGLQVVAKVDQAVGNIAFADDGDLIVSFHPFFKPEIRVARLDPTTGKYQPFPNREWNTPRTENDFYLDDVLGLRSDSSGTVLFLDMGTRGDITPKLAGRNQHGSGRVHVCLRSPSSLEGTVQRR
ncbi:MAG: hypothetical protein ACF8AM_14465 [Rhodopirellula sp. JB055]|uniref:hypothetical protein n=1 Tax=Rhodopirellula sp. JB055 TaxID=3342846 RepID=UPI00370B0C26